VTKREAPDYHTIIKKPMALNDVKKKVEKVPSPAQPGRQRASLAFPLLLDCRSES